MAFEIETLKSELDIFSKPLFQSSIEEGRWAIFRPVSSLQGGEAPLEFLVPPSLEYTDMALSMLHCNVQIVKNNLAPLAATDVVAPVNNTMHSLFSNIEITLNDQTVSSNICNYHYKAIVESLLNYGTASKVTHLANEGFYADTAGHFNALTDNNKGFKARKELFSESKSVELFGALYCDIFNVSKYMLNNVEMKLKLVRTKPAFNLMAAADNYKLIINDASLYVRKVKVAPKIMLAHEEALLRGPANYSFTRTETKVMLINSGVMNANLDNVYLSNIPKRIVIGLVSNTAYNGAITENPFNFKHFNLNYLAIFLNGEQIPSRPLTPDFDKGNWTQAYSTLFSGLGLHYTDNDGSGIKLSEYAHGNTLFVFDLTPDLSSSANHWCSSRQGQLRIELGFKRSLPETVNVIIFSEFNSLITVNSQREVSVDF